jgi:hypothetical protein
MIRLETRERNPVRRAVGISAAVYAGTFLVAVLLHLGVQIPLGFVVLAEPQRPFAVIVEGLAGAVLAVGAYTVFARKSWAWAAVTWAHGLALAGVLWGDGGRRRWPRAPHRAERHVPPGHGGASRSGPNPATDAPRTSFPGPSARGTAGRVASLLAGPLGRSKTPLGSATRSLSARSRGEHEPQASSPQGDPEGRSEQGERQQEPDEHQRPAHENAEPPDPLGAGLALCSFPRGKGRDGIPLFLVARWGPGRSADLSEI